MKLALHHRHRQERIEEALQELGHTFVYVKWDAGEAIGSGADAVLFEFKNILKEELKFLALSRRLRKAGIPVATWCLDLPNIGARKWKLPLLLKAGLVDIFATHSLQGLPEGGRVLYLPNAAWLCSYNQGSVTLEDLRDPAWYTVDVSFAGNIDSERYPEHRHRTDFLKTLASLLRGAGITYRFEDSRHMSFREQVGLIQRSRINLNIGCAADRCGEKSWGLAERCYGIPACGGFLLSDERVHGRDAFVEGEEIVMFGDIDDCFRKILYYTQAHDERRKIAENAHRRVLQEHTYARRMERLLTAVQRVKEQRGSRI
ncbi:MAG: glycosyltransferase [Alphaproteobacteria bacterium]|uniref:Glycosyltransferase n=1 Tax=Candidatus Nitrobium versatile TaxID=2884831 RepID=A0A953JDN3_9BACT|nr:glycosyltransferase [Candidatus Nitrobium versatile]